MVPLNATGKGGGGGFKYFVMTELGKRLCGCGGGMEGRKEMNGGIGSF